MFLDVLHTNFDTEIKAKEMYDGECVHQRNGCLVISSTTLRSGSAMVCAHNEKCITLGVSLRPCVYRGHATDSVSQTCKMRLDWELLMPFSLQNVYEPGIKISNDVFLCWDIKRKDIHLKAG